MTDCTSHEKLNCRLSTDTKCSVQSFASATIQRECTPQFFTFITAELESARVPSLVTFSNSHFPCMRPPRLFYAQVVACSDA